MKRRRRMDNEKEKNPSLPLLFASAIEGSDRENEKEKEKSRTLPHELIVEILLRLPVRSLLRFRQVSPLWSSLISDPQFAKSHFDLNVAPTHRLLLRSLDDDEDKIQSFDLDSSLDGRSAVVFLDFPPPSTWCAYHNSAQFLGSCRGFMLLAYQDTGDVIVWNPTTRFHQRIQEFEFKFMSGCLHGFGYDKSTNDYFVVLIRLTRTNQAEIQVYSLKTKSWHDTKSINFQYKDCGLDYEPGLFLNDSLHWLVTSKDTKLGVVIAFDLVYKSLLEIPLLPNLALRWKYVLRVLGGFLSMCCEGGKHQRAEIWVMKEYKVQSSWTKAFDVSVRDIPRRRFFPICFTEGDGVIGSNDNGRLIKFNAKGNLLEEIQYNHEEEHELKYLEMYRESLLFFPGEQRLVCVTEDEGAEEKAIEVVDSDEEDYYYSTDSNEYEYLNEDEYSNDDDYSTGEVYATEVDDEEATEDEDATEEEETTDDEEEN